MDIYILFQIFHLVAGFTSVIVMYTFILAKRYQKKFMLEENYDETGRVPNIAKITDTSEKLWWNLSITIVFIVYFGFVILYFGGRRNTELLPDAILMGFIVWGIIAIIGYKLTRS